MIVFEIPGINQESLLLNHQLSLAVKVLIPPPTPHPPPAPVVYSTDRKICCFVVYFMRRFVLCLTLYYFVLVFFSPFSIAITSLGERELILVLFVRLFDLCVVWFCRFTLPLGVWEGLRFLIVAFPGLFSNPFLLSES